MRILVVEDEADLNLLLRKVLTKAGYTVDGCRDGEEAQLHLLGAEYDAILLDVMMPKKDGYTLVRELREAGNDTPVLFLTARDSVSDRVKGLDLGADDYVAKPFGMMELISRIKAVLRRSEEPKEPEEYTWGSIYLCPSRHISRVDGADVVLTHKEYELLALLLKSGGKVLSRDMLLETIWGYTFDGETRTVDVHIRKLRQKLGDAGKYIETVKGVGYKLGEPENV